MDDDDNYLSHFPSENNAWALNVHRRQRHDPRVHSKTKLVASSLEPLTTQKHVIHQASSVFWISSLHVHAKRRVRHTGTTKNTVVRLVAHRQYRSVIVCNNAVAAVSMTCTNLINHSECFIHFCRLEVFNRRWCRYLPHILRCFYRWILQRDESTMLFCLTHFEYSILHDPYLLVSITVGSFTETNQLRVECMPFSWLCFYASLQLKSFLQKHCLTASTANRNRRSFSTIKNR